MKVGELFSFKIKKKREDLPKPELIEYCMYTVGELNKRDDLILVDSDIEVEEIKRILGNFPELDDFHAFLVKVQDGEYKEIYGIPSKVPYLNETACRLKVKLGNRILVG